MPISVDTVHHRTIMFELSKPIIIFAKGWPYRYRLILYKACIRGTSMQRFNSYGSKNMSIRFGNHQNQVPQESLQKAKSSCGRIAVFGISIYVMYEFNLLMA